MKSFFVLLGLAVSLSLSASELKSDYFNKRFSITRNEQGVHLIRDNFISKNFSIRVYLEQIKRDLLREQDKMNSLDDYESEIMATFSQEFHSDLAGFANQKGNSRSLLVNSLLQLRDLDIAAIFSNSRFQEVIEKFEMKLKELVLLGDPRILANTQDTTFFAKQARIKEAVSFALRLAKDYLATIPILNTATHVINEVARLLEERREFQHNVLMFYLSSFSAEDLGLKKQEVDLIMSSVYESRIAWWNIFESNAAKLNWDKYGFNKYFTQFRMGSTSLRNHKKRYDEVLERINFAFNIVEFNGQKAIINLMDTESHFQFEPAVAYYFDRPERIKRQRIVLRLAKLGMSFLTIPGFIKNLIGGFVDSKFQQQKLTEGALLAYFEAIGDMELRGQIRSQALNPFLLLP